MNGKTFKVIGDYKEVIIVLTSSARLFKKERGKKRSISSCPCHLHLDLHSPPLTSTSHLHSQLIDFLIPWKGESQWK